MGVTQEWTMLLANVGFPSAVAVYLLLRFEKRIEAQTSAIKELQQELLNQQEEEE